MAARRASLLAVKRLASSFHSSCRSEFSSSSFSSVSILPRSSSFAESARIATPVQVPFLDTNLWRPIASQRDASNSFNLGKRHASTSAASAAQESRISKELDTGAERAQLLDDSTESSTLESSTDALSTQSWAPAIADPGPSEFAASVADSYFPVAIVQHTLENAHTLVGLPWWASIALTTLAIRTALLPVTLYQMKATTKLAFIKPELERLQEQVKTANYDPKTVESVQKEIKDLMRRNGTSPVAPLVGLFIQAPVFISFFFGIRKMSETMPSFQTGGILWFTDLSVPDPLFMLPVISGLSFIAMVELGATEGMEGQAQTKMMKNMLRALGLLIVPLSASFPSALFCYWLPANFFSLIQGMILRIPGVKEAIGVPNLATMAKNAPAPLTPMDLAAASYSKSRSRTKFTKPSGFKQL